MITFENVTMRYAKGAAPALSDVDVEIGRGDFVFVVGASGSGKSTMMRLIILENEVTSGRVMVAGHDLSRLPVRLHPLQLESRSQVGRAQDSETPERDAIARVRAHAGPRAPGDTAGRAR